MATVKKSIKIGLADDHKLIRETWAYLLQSHDDEHYSFEVAFVAADSEDAVKMALERTPDIVMMDINMAPFSGFEATQMIRRANVSIKIIAFSMHSQPAYAKKMLQMGAKGYLSKNTGKEEVFEAIIAVFKGEKFICNEIKNIISDQLADPLRLITKIHTDILRLYIHGYKAREIVKKLNLSAEEWLIHKRRLMEIFEVKSLDKAIIKIQEIAIRKYLE